jgi:hypothetical protein
MPEPKTPEEFMALLDDALFEMEELRAAVEFEEGSERDLSDVVPVFTQIEDGLKQLRSGLMDGSRQLSSGQDLPFMGLVHEWKIRIPVARLIIQVNDLQRRGLT